MYLKWLNLLISYDGSETTLVSVFDELGFSYTMQAAKKSLNFSTCPIVVMVFILLLRGELSLANDLSI